jgi:exopolysaccharide production protein ExoQ
VHASAIASQPRRVQRTYHALAKVARLAERAFAFLALSTLCGTPLLLLQITGAAEGETATRLVKAFTLIPIAGITVSTILVDLRSFGAVLRRNLPLVALVVLMFCSALWSEAPDLTLRRSATLTTTMLFGIYLNMRFTMRDVLTLACWALLSVAIASVLVVVIWPSRGIGAGSFAGEWRGIYPHKQMLGLHAALGAFACTVRALDRQRRSLLAWCGAALCGALTVLSHSATSLLVLALALAALPILRALRRKDLFGLAIAAFALCVAICLLFVVFTQGEALLAEMGKDPSLTGRLPLWRYVLEEIGARPLLGYGYNGFWTGPEGPSAYVLVVTDGWYPWHPHNGWLQLSLDSGVVGVLLFLAGYGTAIRSAFHGDDESWSQGIWPIAYLLFLLLLSVAETVLMRPTTIFTALFAVAAFAGCTEKESRGIAVGRLRGGVRRRVRVNVAASRIAARAQRPALTVPATDALEKRP